jgi:hypothetical protein
MANLTGTLYFNNTDNTTYYRANTSTWIPVGFTGSGLKIDSGHNVTPDVCKDSPRLANLQMCWDGWYKTINFTRNFTSAPNVIVSQERNPSPTGCTCCGNWTSAVLLYVTKVTNKNFTVQAAGTVDWSSPCGATYDGQHSKIDIGWIAIEY